MRFVISMPVAVLLLGGCDVATNVALDGLAQGTTDMALNKAKYPYSAAPTSGEQATAVPAENCVRFLPTDSVGTRLAKKSKIASGYQIECPVSTETAAQ